MVLSLKQVAAKVKGRRCLFDVYYEQTRDTRFGPVTDRTTMCDADREYVLRMAADPRYKILKVTPLKATNAMRGKQIDSWVALGGKLD